MAMTVSSGVPEELRREVYQVLRLKSYPESNASMTEKFRTMPTLEEFMAVIPSLQKNMMRQRPVAQVDAAHEALVEQWTELHIQEWRSGIDWHR